MNVSEKKLLVRLRTGDESAWKQVFDEHWASMCYLAMQYLSDEYQARTAAQDVMSHLWEIRDSLDVNRSLRSYLLQATRYRCLNILSSLPERKMAEALDIDRIMYTEMTDSHHPLNLLMEKELEGRIESAVRDLPPQARNVFRKSRYEGLTYEQIARQLGISVNTVRYHMKVAMNLLKENLGKFMWIFFIFLLHH